MKKKLIRDLSNRDPKNWKKMYPKIYFRKGKNSISVNFNVFVKKHKIDNIIRILPHDFNLINKNMNWYTHFNILDTVNKPGKKYLIIRIYKRGHYDGTTYKQPVLENKHFILARSISVKNNVDYINLNKNVFKHSTSNIKSIKDLKKAIKRRYKKTLSNLSDKEKLSQGVAITKLKIIKRL